MSSFPAEDFSCWIPPTRENFGAEEYQDIGQAARAFFIASNAFKRNDFFSMSVGATVAKVAKAFGQLGVKRCAAETLGEFRYGQASCAEQALLLASRFDDLHKLFGERFDARQVAGFDGFLLDQRSPDPQGASAGI